MTTNSTALDYSFNSATPISLKARTRSSDLRVSADDTEHLKVVITPRNARSEELARNTSVDFQGSTLRIDVPKERNSLFSGSASIDIEVLLPTGSSIDVESSSGDVALEGRLGDVECKTGSGDLAVEHAEQLSATSGSGDVRVTSVRGGAHVRTGSGDIQCEHAGSITTTTGSGDVRIGASGEIRCKSGSGDLVIGQAVSVDGKAGSGSYQIEDLASGGSLSSGSGDIQVNRLAGGRLKAQSASGDVRMALAAGVAALLTVNTVTGDITSDLEETDAPGDGSPTAEMVITTVSGDVSLTRAAALTD